MDSTLQSLMSARSKDAEKGAEKVSGMLCRKPLLAKNGKGDKYAL